MAVPSRRTLLWACTIACSNENVGCHLCHQALDTLLLHSEFLTAISEVDIDTDPELVERFGKSVPVVVIDGRERFRGQVNVLLLRRLIDATVPHAPPQ